MSFHRHVLHKKNQWDGSLPVVAPSASLVANGSNGKVRRAENVITKREVRNARRIHEEFFKRMADLSSFSDSGFDANSGSDKTSKGVDAELEGFLMLEKQKAELTAQIHEFNDFCWEKCVDKPGIKLDSRTETCLNNCVDRFIDVSLFITNRFSQLLQKSAGGY